MRIQVVSDLHLEFRNPIPELAADADAIIVAGDLAPAITPGLRRSAERWAAADHILYVPGNHEFYRSDIDEARQRLAEECCTLGVTLLDREAVTINGVRFIGATLWTDFLLNGVANEAAAHAQARALSDFNGSILQQGRTRPFTSFESVQQHKLDREFIEHELAAADNTGTTAVVISHHSPTPRSIAPHFYGHPCNPGFASNLEALIAQYQPALWVHGHMHNHVDEQLGRTRVLANPGGYNARENPEYDPQLCVDIDAGGEAKTGHEVHRGGNREGTLRNE